MSEECLMIEITVVKMPDPLFNFTGDEFTFGENGSIWIVSGLFPWISLGRILWAIGVSDFLSIHFRHFTKNRRNDISENESTIRKFSNIGVQSKSIFK